jgi:type I restriction enzyme R subunit
VDLSKIDFERLKEDFQRPTYKNIEIADLRAFIQHKLDQMLNKRDLRRLCQRLQGISMLTTPVVHRRTITLTNWLNSQDLKEESERHIAKV